MKILSFARFVSIITRPYKLQYALLFFIIYNACAAQTQNKRVSIPSDKGSKWFVSVPEFTKEGPQFLVADNNPSPAQNKVAGHSRRIILENIEQSNYPTTNTIPQKQLRASTDPHGWTNRIPLDILLFGAAGILFWLIVYQNKKADNIKCMQLEKNAENIAKLYSGSQLKIAELEEKNKLAKEAIKKELAGELHHNLAGTLASVKMQLTRMALARENLYAHQKLLCMAEQINKAYEATRNLSHSWFSDAPPETSFDEQVTALVNTILPGDLYKKEISLEPGALKKISTTTMIELLRIIREACINIVKHAQARKVQVSIYDDKQFIILNIADDGKGMPLQSNSLSKSQGIGLYLISESIKALNGSINFYPGNKGTQLVVQLP
ncbi:MAG: ATP-binding protein, partial [Bacteroidetes bacterium]|nr:ATP-binding protein [Bacteroidota bacterium]